MNGKKPSTSGVMLTVSLRSALHYGHRAPPQPLGELLRLLPLAVQQSVCMAFTGQSSVRGRRPAWLRQATDIRLVEYAGSDMTVLKFEVPRLGDAAAELYRRREEWPSKPAVDDTGFDLLADVLCDVANEDSDSDRFDQPLLQRIVRFKRAMQSGFQEIAITGNRYGPDHPCLVNEAVVETARRLCSNTPSPQQARIVGNLDVIRASTRTFALKLDNGEEIRGLLATGDVEKLASLFRRRVMVLGKAVFRPSGRLLRIDADEVVPAAVNDRLFSVPPKPQHRALDVRNAAGQHRRKKGLSAVFGRWPGNETDEEIEQALRELS